MPDLDTSGFREVWSEDFSDPTLDPALDLAWGRPFAVSGGEAHFESTAASGWAPSGLMQRAWGAEAGQGYGLYSFSGRMEGNQGAGPAMLLWPATNAWPGPEVDAIESADPSRETGYWAVHYRGDDGQDHYDVRPVAADLTREHEYSVLWEPGRLTYYLDGEEIATTTEHVPVAAEDGGQNLVMAVQVSGSAAWPQPGGEVDLHVSSMSYAEPLADTAQSAPLGAPEPGPEAPVDWDAVAAAVLETYRETGTWEPVAPADAPPDGPPPAADPVDWDAVAATVLANHAETGQWFL